MGCKIISSLDKLPSLVSRPQLEACYGILAYIRGHYLLLFSGLNFSKNKNLQSNLTEIKHFGITTQFVAYYLLVCFVSNFFKFFK